MMFRTCVLALVLSLCGSMVSAAGWVAILKDTPADKFQDEDLQMFLDTARQVLEAEDNSQPVDWANPDTGAGGSFKVLGRSKSAEGLDCKRVRFTVYATKRSPKSSTWTACRTAEGKWRLQGAG